MPSAVSAKVADILSKYSRPHSAASLRSSSPQTAHRPPLKLHQSADFSHARFPRADDDDDDDLLLPPSRQHHRTATAPQRSMAKVKAKAAVRDEYDDVDIEEEKEEDETVYSEEETATVRRSSSSSSLSSSQRLSRAPKPASRRADEWEDEMMDEFGDDDDDNDAAPPVKPLPLASSHTRSASAPASKKGAVQAKPTQRPQRQGMRQEEAEAVVEFEEELLIADSPVNARQFSAPPVVAKPTVSVVREEEEEEVYTEVEEAEDEPVAAVAAPAALKPAVNSALHAVAHPATVPTTPAAASQPKQEMAIRKEEEEVVTEDEREEEPPAIRSFLAASPSPPPPPLPPPAASASVSALPKTDEYEEDFEDVKITPRPAVVVKQDSRAEERRQLEKPTAKPQPMVSQPVRQKDSKEQPLSSHAAERKYQQEEQVEDAAAEEEERLVLIDDDYRQQREEGRAAASRSQRRKKRYIHITSISTQTDISHNPLPQQQQQRPVSSLLRDRLPAASIFLLPSAAPGYGYYSYPAAPAHGYPYYAMQPPPFAPYYYPTAPPPLHPPPLAGGWHTQQPYWPQATTLPGHYHPQFPMHSHGAGAWQQSSPSLSASFASPPPPQHAAQSSPSPLHQSFTAASSSSTQATTLPIRVDAWPELQQTTTEPAGDRQPFSSPEPQPMPEAAGGSAIVEEEAKTRQQTVSSSPFRSGPVTVDAFVSATPTSRLVQAMSSPLRSACGSCGSLPSPSPLYFSSITPFPASSRPVTSFFTRSYSSAPAGVSRSPGLSLCSDTLYPISSGLNPADANAAFRHQLSVLRSSLNSYRSALELALP